MIRKRNRLVASATAIVCLMAAFASCTENPPGTGGGGGGETPIIFVHGLMGSGDQYRAMAQYFASNGYPAERIKALDYNSSGLANVGPIVDSVRREFNVDKVYLVGHSMGTIPVASYGSSNPEKVDKYILVDGAGCMGNSRCLAIAASSMPAGGTNRQTHVEASVSPESFAKQYQHFMGRPPSTTRVVPETGPTVKLAGRVQRFQRNDPIANTPVQVWETDPDTAARVGATPAATTRTDGDGFFPAVTVPRGKTYEIAVARPGLDGATFHYYFQAFQRSDLLLRMNMTMPGDTSYDITDRGPNHSAMAVIRNREFWPNKGAQSDELTIKTTTSDGRTQPEVDVFQNMRSQVVGIHIHDNGSPGQSSLQSISGFGAFQAGVDVFMPAATPPNGTITITNIPRGDRSKPQTINVANWASDANGISVSFNDWVS